MSALELDAEAARSAHRAVPLVARPSAWWPTREQMSWCWFLAFVNVAEVALLAYEIFWRR